MQMDTPAPMFIFLFLLSILIVCSSGVKDIERKFHSSHKEVISNTIQHDLINYPTLTNPAGQVTNPTTVTVPPNTPTPSIITVPSATPPPVTVTPTPATTTSPITNPVTTPAVAPPAAPTTAAPAVSGQSWCVARSGVPANSVQTALDYACGIGGADCSAIQQGASCYNPITLQNHASYAFNSYYQKHPGPTSCDFGGTAVLTNVNPSSGSCVFPTSSSSSSVTPTTPSPVAPTPTTPSPTTPSPITPTPTTPSPVMTTPTPTTPSPTTPTPTTPSPITTTPTPTTSSSSGATTPTPTSWGGGPLPTILNASNPGFGGTTTSFGDSPPFTNTSSISISPSLQQPFISCIIMVTSIIKVLGI